VTIDDILIVYDDISLKLGDIRLKSQGGAGGHNGMRSIIETLGRKDFSRLRFGIDNQREHKELSKYVLSAFKAKAEVKIKNETVELAAEAVLDWFIKDIDFAIGSANSTLDCDVMETRAFRNVFGTNAKNIPITSIKSMVGETFSASGAMSITAGLCAINEGFLPKTLNYEQPDRRCDLDYVNNKKSNKKANKILINTFSPTGANSVMVIGECG